MSKNLTTFAPLLMAWQRLHGRHDLPWQRDRDPYRVWLSEVMLQQTQVVTVLTYFDRFMQRFPTVVDLANAHVDEVMGLWSGLGYYSRARNLHACAKAVAQLHGGEFPSNSASLQTLPGIGRSTAAAVAATSFGERVSILDGNAKRVLARYLGFAENLAETRHEKALWAQAAAVLPKAGPASRQEMPVYTQGLMDLGALVCTAKKPACGSCPVSAHCAAFATGQQLVLPVKKKQLKRTHASHWLLWVTTAQPDQTGQPERTLWVRRPQKGIWAGLLCLPVFDTEQAMLEALPGQLQARVEPGPVVQHALTHKDLRLHFMRLVVDSAGLAGATHGMQAMQGQWLSSDEWLAQGLPAPIRRVLQSHPVPGAA